MDAPTVTVLQTVDPKGVPCFTVEVAVEVRQSGSVLLVVDLSDSSQVTAAEIARLPRLLSPLPRTWGVQITGLGDAAFVAASRRGALTIGDVIDGVVNLGDTLFDPAVIARERAAGSFLSPALNRFVSSAAPETTRLFALIVSDGRLADVDPVGLPGQMQVLGLTPDHGHPDVARWNGIVPGATLIGRDTDMDAIGALRSAAGCSFHGPCMVILPDGACRMRAANDAAAASQPPTTEKRRPWDFSLRGKLLLEFVGSNVPDHIVIEGADKASVRLALPKPSATRSRSEDAPRRPQTGSDHEVIHLTLDPADAIAVVKKAHELAEARAPWQGVDGSLAIVRPDSSLAARLVDASQRPRADGFLLIAAGEEDLPTTAESRRVLLVPLTRGCRFEVPSSTDASPLAPCVAAAAWSFHFDNLENRWILGAANAAPAALPPKGSHGLPVDVRDDRGRSCHVFFSGPMWSP